MSSSRRRDARAALAAAALFGCGRTPVASHEPDRDGTRAAAVVDAPAPTVTPADAPEPDAPMKPTLSPSDQAALDDAVRALSDEHPEGWRPAMSWLIAHPEPARPRLVAIVERGGGPADLAVERAATVLGEIGDPADVPVLAGALARGGELAAWGFGQSLAIHRAPEALAALIEATRADDRFAARAAAGALGSRHDQGGRAALEALLDHERSEVRYTAVLALIELGARPSRAALQHRKQVETDGEVRGALRKALAK